MKNGTAIRGKESMEVISFCAATSSGSGVKKAMPPIEAAAMAIAIGTPAANRTTIATSMKVDIAAQTS